VAYDHNKASQQISKQIIVDPQGQGDVEVWQEDLLTPAEVGTYAENLKHTYLWQTAVFTGSVEQRLIPGTYVHIDNTYQSTWNKKNYLVIECDFIASQRSAILANGADTESTNTDTQRIFSCTFAAIPLTQAFCPKVSTKMPSIGGVIPAFIIDSTNSNITIPINQDGCYQVAFSAQPQAQTYWLRMCQPYAGDNFGSMAPLHAGTEVMLSFLYGNPDLPIINNAVFNSTHQTIFNQSSSQKSGIISANNNSIILTDKENANSVVISSPTGNARITVGSDASSDSSGGSGGSGSSGVSMWTTGDTTSYSRGDFSSITEGTKSDVVLGVKTGLTMGAASDIVIGNKLGVSIGIHTEVNGAYEIKIALLEVLHQAAAKFQVHDTSHTTVVGASIASTLPEAVIYLTPDFSVEALDAITFEVGPTIISITDVGISIYAPEVNITAPLVNIVASEISMMGNVSVTGNLLVNGFVDVIGDTSLTGQVMVMGDICGVGMFTYTGEIEAL